MNTRAKNVVGTQGVPVSTVGELLKALRVMAENDEMPLINLHIVRIYTETHDDGSVSAAIGID